MKKLFVLLTLFALLVACSSSTDDSVPPVPVIVDPVDDTPPPNPIPPLSDEEMMDLVQRETFKYFWDFAQSDSGAARERYIPSNPGFDQNTVTTGGSGFGLMSILVGIERGYVSRSEGFERLNQIITFFENADRFRGAWSHWIDGTNGNAIAFSALDDGGDLVETALFVQGLICVQEYFKSGSAEEIALSNKADVLWKGVEWDWYTQGQNVLYWHWSPENDFAINLRLTGYNETMITYVLAASSPEFAITPAVYNQGWASNGGIRSAGAPYGFPLVLNHSGSPQNGGPLFFSHYSFLGLDPTNLSDQYAANYKTVAVNHSKINYQYCVSNPLGYAGYGVNNWGLTASYTRNADGSLGYTAHSPDNDRGVISPTAAISSIPYTPEESLRAMHYFYQNKARLLGTAGFYDAFSPQFGFWVAEAYLAIDQGPEIIMIENYRTGLLWNLFMQNEDIQNGLTTLGFTY